MTLTLYIQGLHHSLKSAFCQQIRKDRDPVSTKLCRETYTGITGSRSINKIYNENNGLSYTGEQGNKVFLWIRKGLGPFTNYINILTIFEVSPTLFIDVQSIQDLNPFH